MITNFQSQNVRSPLIVKQERSVHYVPKKIYDDLLIFSYDKNNLDTNSRRKVQNLRIKFTKLRL